MLSKQQAIEYAKAICKEHLYYFYRDYVACDFRENLQAPHIKKLAEKLTALKNGEINRLCVAMPPRHSKSSMITLAFPLWLLSKDKTLNILIVNNSAGLSEKFGIQLREYVKQIGPEFDLYLSDVKHSSTYLMFTDSQGKLYKGSIRLVGSSGSITGQDADYIILDDVYAGFDDITPSLLQKKIDWFKTIIEQRIEPHTKLVILHTRWHSEDLQGYLKDNYPDDYEFLEFPAIDENGQPLWPQRYTIDDYRKKQEAMGERQFQAIYQQQPLDLTSDFFYMDHLIFEDQFDDYAIAKCRSWDIASSDDKLGDQRDYTVGVRMCKTGNGQYWIFDYERGQYGNDVLHIIKQTAKLDTPNHKILLETGTKGGASGLLFNDYKKALNGYSTIQSDPTAMTKADRATPLRHAIYDGLVHVMIRNDNRRQAFIDEFKEFPNSKHDDIVDAVAHGFNYLKQFNGNSVKTGGTRRRRKIR
jgi:hypothetical protein